MAKQVVKEIDHGYNKIKQRVQDTARKLPVAVVGVQGVAGQEIREEGMTNAYLASIHEFGTRDKRVPERSFMRSTFDEKIGEYQRWLDKLAKIFYSNKPFPGGGKLEGQLLILGEKFRGDIIKKIKTKIGPPLKEATKRARASKTAKKGGGGLPDTPLWYTGTMVNSISVVVENGPHAKS